MYSLVRALLFRLEAEEAHRRALALARSVGRFPPARAVLAALARVESTRLEVSAFGLKFKNPVGLAAGYDKGGRAIAGLSALGLGHLEIGTVTVRPQPGNQRPRVHRFLDERALVNSMGFPNEGVGDLLAQRFEPRGRCVIGVNIGKNKDTPLERAADDYCELIRRVAARADYIAINISSPNTPGLRQLQDRGALEDLLRAVTKTRDAQAHRVPLLVKIAPDLSEAEVDTMLEAMSAAAIDGVIATNTTTDRSGLPERAQSLPGGTSGAPLNARALAMTRLLAGRTHGKLPIIGVGGILTPQDAIERLRAGAHLIQLYTGLIYEGPFLVRRVLKELVRTCQREGLTSVSELGGGAR
ncbi:MAG TPA: quinone-dependent dihydroorotate dehydrogenase [Planctomycetota bacterium]|nr:quinone-dependent dihydroorotate dehydrogenase [Planctomycetota bacterium]